ncbi:MAG: T9SS type A sorting domain-containing protein, partial [bacterium]
QNYPNPFNPMTIIKFNLPKSCEVTLKIYNILGEEVETLLSAFLYSGLYSKQWNAAEMPGGIYYYRIQAGNYREVKKMILLK